MPKFLLSTLLLATFLAPIRIYAQEPSFSQLMQLTQAGASLELDLRKNSLTAAELTRLAASLKYQATLTLIMPENRRISLSQCAQIAKARPGQVIFRF